MIVLGGGGEVWTKRAEDKEFKENSKLTIYEIISNFVYKYFGWLYHYRCKNYDGKTLEWSDKTGWHRID